MKNFNRIASLVVLLAAFCSVSLAQTALIQTSITSAVPTGPVSLAGGAQGNLTFQVAVASATGITGAFLGTQPVTYLYVDQELMGVIGLVQGQTLVFNVLRAQSGTKAGFHQSGSVALVGTMSPQFGGQAGSGGFQTADPPLGGVCNLANTGLSPWVNILTGAQWLCSAVAGAPATNGTWIPGFNNPLAAVSPGTSAAVASAATLTPSGPFFHVTGAVAITAFGIPVGLTVNGTAGSAGAGYGSFCYTTDSTATTTATNNISAVATGAAGLVFCWRWDTQTSKFFPLP